MDGEFPKLETPETEKGAPSRCSIQLNKHSTWTLGAQTFIELFAQKTL